MTNFDFLKNDKRFASFCDAAISAENLLHVDIDACVVNCRKALEFALKWLYSADDELHMPKDDSLISMMRTKGLKKLLGNDIWRRIDYIRRLGNGAAHDFNEVSTEQAELCLENLFVFLDFVAYCYGDDHNERKFDPTLLELTPEEALSFVPGLELDLEQLIRENLAMKKYLTSQRQKQQQSYIPRPLDQSEVKTRKLYVLTKLHDAGWRKNVNMRSGITFVNLKTKQKRIADYVLYDHLGKPIGIVDVKNTCNGVDAGQKYASECAEIIKGNFGRRPAVFFTDGFDMFIDDGKYPIREIKEIYSCADLEKLFTLRKRRAEMKKQSTKAYLKKHK